MPAAGGRSIQVNSPKRTAGSKLVSGWPPPVLVIVIDMLSPGGWPLVAKVPLIVSHCPAMPLAGWASVTVVGVSDGPTERSSFAAGFAT